MTSLHWMLAAAIALGLTNLAFQWVAHRRWSRWADARSRELARLWAAHKRVVDKVYPQSRPVLPPPPTRAFPVERRADWSDDRQETRKLNGKETFLPVDFQHDLW